LGGDSATFREKTFHMGFYGDVGKRVYNNIHYIANLLALKQWYDQVRKPFFAVQEMGAGLYEGAMSVLKAALDERLTRFKALSEKMETSIRIGEKILKGSKKKALLQQQKELLENWSDLAKCFAGGEEQTGLQERTLFKEGLKPLMDQGGEYVQVIQGLDPALSRTGARWLQQMVDDILDRALTRLPSYRDR
jgi:UDP-N-acetylglucosamine/UDP-N-acetylgalactosamine diphosphorylase